MLLDFESDLSDDAAVSLIERLAAAGGARQLDKAPSVLVCAEPGFP